MGFGRLLHVSVRTIRQIHPNETQLCSIHEPKTYKWVKKMLVFTERFLKGYGKHGLGAASLKLPGITFLFILEKRSGPKIQNFWVN